MKPLRVTRYGPIVSAVCAGCFLILAVVTAMAHEKSIVISTCAVFALGSIVLTNFQLRAQHAQKAAEETDAKPPTV